MPVKNLFTDDEIITGMQQETSKIKFYIIAKKFQSLFNKCTDLSILVRMTWH